MKRVVVYDFDKTLTYRDTLFGFFRHAAVKGGLYPVKLGVYLSAMVGAKLGMIDNTRLKEIGIKLFLASYDRRALENIAKSYQNKIGFNTLYHTIDVTQEIRCLVVSASFEVYLEGLFDDNIEVIGSRLAYDETDRVCGLEMNCYRNKKVEALASRGVERIDILYTDSYSDIFLARISNEIRVVKGDRVIHCENIEAFERLLKR